MPLNYSPPLPSPPCFQVAAAAFLGLGRRVGLTVEASVGKCVRGGGGGPVASDTPPAASTTQDGGGGGGGSRGGGKGSWVFFAANGRSRREEEEGTQAGRSATKHTSGLLFHFYNFECKLCTQPIHTRHLCTMSMSSHHQILTEIR